jgi:succinate dehydrogenase / fumarate reductase cytochrome b subunit
VGIVISLEARPRWRAAPGPGLTSYLLQRVSGIVVLAFVIWHVGETRIEAWIAELAPEDRFGTLCAQLSATTGGVPLRAVGYLVGLAAATYHLANGLRAFCLGWGITASRRALRRAAAMAAILGLGLFALGATTIIYLSTGIRLVADASALDEPSPADCPAAATVLGTPARSVPAAPTADPSPSPHGSVR